MKRFLAELGNAGFIGFHELSVRIVELDVMHTEFPAFVTDLPECVHWRSGLR